MSLCASGHFWDIAPAPHRPGRTNSRCADGGEGWTSITPTPAVDTPVTAVEPAVAKLRRTRSMDADGRFIQRPASVGALTKTVDHLASERFVPLCSGQSPLRLGFEPANSTCRSPGYCVPRATGLLMSSFPPASCTGRTWRCRSRRWRTAGCTPRTDACGDRGGAGGTWGGWGDSDRGVTFVQRCPKLAFLCGSRSGSARPVRAEATDHVRV